MWGWKGTPSATIRKIQRLGPGSVFLSLSLSFSLITQLITPCCVNFDSRLECRFCPAVCLHVEYSHEYKTPTTSRLTKLRTPSEGALGVEVPLSTQTS